MWSFSYRLECNSQHLCQPYRKATEGLTNGECQATPRRFSTQPFSFLIQVDDLKEALQEMFKTSGVKGTPLLFLMTDGQIVNERFLIYINDILANGWISDLFPKVSF